MSWRDRFGFGAGAPHDEAVEVGPASPRGPFAWSARPNSSGLANEAASDTDAALSLSSKVARTARARIASVLARAIAHVADVHERQEILAWFVDARDVLADDLSPREKSAGLYALLDARRVGHLVSKLLATTARNYRDADLPLALKVTLPVTAVGAAALGAQGAGIVAFGGGVGVPVVLLLFLGAAGVTSILEPFVHRSAGGVDGTTRLLLALVLLQESARLKRELYDELRRDAKMPQQKQVSPEEGGILIALRRMDPYDFESHVMWLFQQRLGHPASTTNRTRDKGLDGFVAVPDHGLVVVQCKRYAETNKVGSPAVQQFWGVVEQQGAVAGYLVTTSSFSKEAQSTAESTDKLVLVDGDELARWHLEVCADQDGSPG